MRASPKCCRKKLPSEEGTHEKLEEECSSCLSPDEMKLLMRCLRKNEIFEANRGAESITQRAEEAVLTGLVTESCAAKCGGKSCSTAFWLSRIASQPFSSGMSIPYTKDEKASLPLSHVLLHVVLSDFLRVRRYSLYLVSIFEREANTKPILKKRNTQQVPPRKVRLPSLEIENCSGNHVKKTIQHATTR